ncbi:hypothetical protein [Sphingobacterium corticibacter]|uniref:Uncharacterized protein n=1 Tax=Sphingobacterium corticibacter TaxID=2171749 RepID=A0A2T8HEK1_9SPHI|nr:hypothetical protein [Sphingobacterium corticibacter]PVH23858.1 hypothetical protein DC487_17055 [Sphingobacterium corticibacter]
MKNIIKKFFIALTSSVIFTFLWFIDFKDNQHGITNYYFNSAQAQQGNPQTFTFSLINPPRSSIDMAFGGGQRVDASARNNNVIGASLIWTENRFGRNIYQGLMLPGQVATYVDGILATNPRYSYTGSTASSTASIGFTYTTRL